MTIGVVDVTGSSDTLRGQNAVWFLHNSNTAGLPDVNPFAFGAGTFTPVAGNWNFPDLPLHASGVGPGGAAERRRAAGRGRGRAHPLSGPWAG